nr:glutathione S-transferase N-terminal domain-containing protein [Pseudoalteromonas denitrificans]
MKKLIWVYDSPFSRSIKWLLMHYRVPHEDYVLTWDEMATDPLLASNPKMQVPMLWSKNTIQSDSLLIALEYLPDLWHQSVDAQFFRLADSDVETSIIFLFRANLLKNKFGESENSQFMLQAGVDTYKKSVDYLLDYIMVQNDKFKCNYGAVLLLSTLFSAVSLAEYDLASYRINELKVFISVVESDEIYQSIIDMYQGQPSNSVPFRI